MKALSVVAPRAAVGLLFAGLAGCASTNPRPAFDAMQEKLRGQTGHELAWPKDAEDSEQALSVVHELLSKPLSVDAAVRVALLNNRELLAVFEEIGVSQADLAEASRIANPTFHGSLRFSSGPYDNTEIGIGLNFLDVFILPLKKKIARTELERTQMRVASEVVQVAASVKTAFFELLGAEEILERLTLMQEIRQAAADFAFEQEQAGNLSELDLEQHRAANNQLRVDVVRARIDVRMKREALNRMLGLWGEDIHWQSRDGLPPIPEDDPTLDALESSALENRFDVAAARKGVEQVARALGLKKGTRFFPAGIDIGVESERETDGARVTGPTLSLELPIFNQGQPAVARLTSQLHQSQRRLEHLSIRVRSEVRQSRDSLIAARELTEYYRDRLIPQRRDIVTLTLEQYNMMLRGTYDLLAAREREVETERSYVEAWRDYWIVRAELERALGGRLPPASPASLGETSRLDTHPTKESQR